MAAVKVRPQAVTPRGPTRSGRSVAERSLVGLVLFQGLTGLAGGAAMVAGAVTNEPSASAMVPPADWLDGLPFDTWLVPGLVLALGLGVGPLVVAWGLVRRPQVSWMGWLERATKRHWSWSGALALGVGLTAWIVLEVVLLPELSILQAIYGPVGLAIIALAMLPDIRAGLATPDDEVAP